MTTILWFRRDLRLSDHAALTAACAAGPVVAVFIRDATVDQLGAAPAWRLGLALEHLAQALAARGQRLILRSGRAEQVLAELVAEVDAKRIYWTRCYDPQSRERDTEIKSRFRAKGIDVRSFGGTVLFEPTTVETKTGGPYKVFSPYWKTVKTRDVDAPLPEPGKIPPPETWPASANLADWALGARMRRGGDVVRAYLHPGETAAQNRLAEFAGDSIALYHQRRDLPAVDGTSGLSEYLTYGEVSPHQCWHAGLRAREEHSQGAEAFLRELAWRDFATHLMVHWPDMLDSNWRAGWDNFAWREDESLPEVIAWQQARTGVPLVDAGLREMYVTGRMHNRVRMVVASYLTKHMLMHWRIGQRWFGECLTDWDAASNAMGWQWVAGSGPDAAPYFRVFNPESQAKKFDPQGAYVRRWIAEGQANPPATARAYFDAIPKSWNITPGDLYPAPVVGLDAGRKRALLAYENRGF